MDGRYVPGQCNIGKDEVTLRRRIGWAGLGASATLFILLVATRVPIWWELVIFVPATLAASGFLEAHFRFCAFFARRGVFNFGSLGEARSIADPQARAMDRRQGDRIITYSLLIGAAAACIAVAASAAFLRRS